VAMTHVITKVVLYPSGRTRKHVDFTHDVDTRTFPMFFFFEPGADEATLIANAATKLEADLKEAERQYHLRKAIRFGEDGRVANPLIYNTDTEINEMLAKHAADAGSLGHLGVAYRVSKVVLGKVPEGERHAKLKALLSCDDATATGLLSAAATLETAMTQLGAAPTDIVDKKERRMREGLW